MLIKELRKQYADKLEKFDSIKATADMEELRQLNKEILELKERIEILSEERDLEVPTFEEKVERSNPKETEVRDLTPEQVDKEYEQTFLRAFRGKKLTERDHQLYERMLELRDAPNVTPHLKSDTDEDGGFIVPHSVSTKIQEYKRLAEYDLTQLISVQKTSVLSGEFTYEKLGTITPWQNISQWETIPEVETPQWERKEFKIEDYAGILPIPRTLLQDTDQNLLNHIARYIARKTIVTRNAKVLAVIKETFKTKVPVANTDDFKDILDLKLDPAFIPSTAIVTNQYGYNFLRKLKDHKGHYLLQPDVTQPDRKLLDGKPVTVLPDRELPNPSKDKAPVYVGDFKEAVQLFDRGVYEITPTTVGGNAFTRNSYDIRVIDRFDVVALDEGAIVYGEIDLKATPAPSETA